MPVGGDQAPRRRLAAALEPPARECAPDLRDAVHTAVESMDWLADSDQAMKALAMWQAEEIEKAMKTDKPIGGRLAQLRADAAGEHDS
ncbi:hypothetical protein ACFYY8_29425 [Streptosporangium sp. NPDC001559]|uniref:terminase small subunit n=1 Tax=Streptosporangium sp. NPDC001559 TaxID=3366187 RepID=UPI0036EFA6E5